MKALLLSLALLSPFANAAEPLQVQLNDANYYGAVRNALDAKGAPYVFVKTAGKDNFLKINVAATPQGFGVECKADIDMSIDGAEGEMTVTKSELFLSRDKHLAYCQKVLADALTQTLQL